jgi:putative modified peptide
LGWRTSPYEQEAASAEEDPKMSQRNVELVIGKLATDEDFRRRFAANPEAALAQAAGFGVELTEVERHALADLEMDACERFAARVDARLQKICLSRKRAS